jgi:ankyrin repeat protein
MLSIQTDEFLEAIQKGNLSKVNQLLETNPALANSKAKDGTSAILLALYHGQKNIAEAITTKKTELDIFEASTLGKLDLAKSLIDRNPPLVSAYSSDGFALVALTAYLGQKETTEFLIGKGADVNAVARNPTGFTALTGAVANNHTEIAKLLVKGGAQVNYRYEGGFSPLMAAAEHGNVELVNFLLANGADPNAKTGDGKNAMSFAKEGNHVEVIEALRKHGAL